ncbi:MULTISPECIES: PhzF family phenazine biosynthesis protein [Vibrio]|uniref:PhzF family phenazine biosynthesis protein n=1 Tax=Vibrio TaxID=662 RepID=UPI0009F8B3A1|nr:MULTISPECIES: PhzF family phenazine biosynthesis protein [Vibrio]AYO22384.1 PhzF family phenazine biosynthesis protein [Vibrio owensii]
MYDVFCSEDAQGNPCGVVFLSEWLSDSEMLEITQSIAQPITSFLCCVDGRWWIRWFSLTSEINLCGHGSMGAGAALIAHLNQRSVKLHSNYGDITIAKHGTQYQMALPAWDASPVPASLDLQLLNLEQSGVQVLDVVTTRDLVVVLASEQQVKQYQPDFERLCQIRDFHAVMVTAQSGPNDYVLRYFAPKIGINEDIATGSAQCSLAPYWFKKLDVDNLNASQFSSKGGFFQVAKLSSDTLVISASARLREQ